MTKTQICIDYRHKYPDFPNAKLARIILKEQSLVFDSSENIRTILRRVEGNTGNVLPKDKSLASGVHRPVNPYNLPNSDANEYKPFIFRGHKKVGILSDIHVPYHDVEALSCAIRELKKQKIDGLLLNGDTMDCHHLSSFTKDPYKRGFAEELEALNELIKVLKKELKCKIYFKIGNHEARYENFLFSKAKELSGIDEYRFERIIKARENDITVIESNRYMRIGNLNGIHGHEYRGGITVPVSIARGLYLRGKTTAFQGHNHSTSEYTDSDMNGKITTTWSLGCLCELNPDYMPLNKWNHGFAWVELEKNGKDFKFYNKRIYKGEVL